MQAQAQEQKRPVNARDVTREPLRQVYVRHLAVVRAQLLSQANEWGQISWNNGSSHASDQHVGQMLQLIVATREYQFA